MDIENEIITIRERNLKVESDKAWETSLTRKSFIAVLTYIVAVLWLWLIDESKFVLKALVPVVGYLLSTISIPILKKIWIKHYLKK